MPVTGGPLILPFGGVSQGRADTGFGTDYSTTLGSFSGRYDEVDFGDYQEVKQNVDLTDVDVLTFKLALRGRGESRAGELIVLGQFNDFADQKFTLDYMRDLHQQPTIVTNGSPLIIAPGVTGFGDGCLDLDAASAYVEYQSALPMFYLEHKATIHVRVKPGYSGTPTDDQGFFFAYDNGSGNNNKILLYHSSSAGGVHVGIYNSAGASIVSDESNVWNPSADAWVLWTLIFDVTVGTGFGARLYKDGTQVGTTIAGTGARTGTIDRFGLGDPPGGSEVQDVRLDEFHVYNDVMHTTNFAAPTEQTRPDGPWLFEVRAGGSIVWEEEIDENFDAEFAQRAVNVVPFTGSMDVSFRLTAL